MEFDVSIVLLGIGAVALAVGLVVLWQVVGQGPRRRRGLRRVHQCLQQGKWQEGLERVGKLRVRGRPSPTWQKRFDEAEADCLQTARDQALAEKKFEKALERAIRVAELREKPEVEARAAIQGAMLEEIRRLFATGNNREVHDMVGRTLLVQSPCREASFWQGLCFLREGQTEQGFTSLQTARTGEARTLALGDFQPLGNGPGPSPGTPVSPFVDPPLYLGALLLRQGQAKEALRYFTEANRVDSNCPVVTLHLGSAMIASGGDNQLAVRALQRALGPKGLGQWNGDTRVWVEAFPEHRSFVRKLASKHPFVCPLWGADLQFLTRQGNLALAQGLYRLGQYQEASDLYSKVLQEGAPSWAVLRGLGLALARLGKYDDAFKHLRTAHEMEETKDRITAGYLALCGAMGKPSREEDKVRNVTWAIQLVTRFNAPKDAEWTSLVGTLFAEAREHQVPQTLDDQVYLCEHLLSVRATDPQAAQAYHHLQASYPQAMHPEYAWLFCRAVQEHGVVGEHALELFALTFAHQEEARAFFQQQQWDFSEVELTYLARAAELAPGQFPANLGADYAAKGEHLLLARSREQEQAGQLPAALASADILVKLAPQNPRALDRLAYLHYRLGQSEQALGVLNRWQDLHPGDPVPLVRQAVFLQQKPQESRDKVRQALQLSQGSQRAEVAFFGARLVLHQGRETSAEGMTISPGALATAQEFLEECVACDTNHLQGLECLTAVRWLRGDQGGLAGQAGIMDRGEVADGLFHYCAALCHLAGQNHGKALEACQRVVALNPVTRAENSERNGSAPAAVELHLGLESSYLAGLAYLNMTELEQAGTALQPVAETTGSPSASLAQALLGATCFAQNRHEDAVRWWQKLDGKKRAAWKLMEPLAGTIFLTAVEALHAGRYEEAAEKFRSAGKLGSRDRQLGPLLVQALFQAGQEAYYGKTEQPS